ncbi:site-specific recombinase XerD [Salinibacter ruber]|uniref:site-specific integrase n=1 Tax=Salinibacter ruber TaxID=146919 RepID=UPI002168E3FB|nr:site-specific integrase [Salinibacter ruber]MCS4139508.1 site-specific recombinase XerD [Salinibacter ruber]
MPQSNADEPGRNDSQHPSGNQHPSGDRLPSGDQPRSANRLPGAFEADLPPLISGAEPETQERFLEFFLAEIRNENTRKAYGRAVARFLRWAGRQDFSLEGISPMVVSAYVEQLKPKLAPATVKQHLSAIRRLFGYLQATGALPENPAEPVRGPKHNPREGSTPILTAEEASRFIEGLPTGSIKGKRDKAIIGVLTYTFARVSAVVNLSQEDYFQAGRRRKLRLQEKGGKRRDVPLHHKATDYLEEYLEAGGRLEEKGEPLFRTMTRQGDLSGRPMDRTAVLRMVKSRASDEGLDPDQVCCHTFRGTGITAYLQNGGKLEVAQHIAGHADASTTKLYDRRRELVSKEEVEKIGI